MWLYYLHLIWLNPETDWGEAAPWFRPNAVTLQWTVTDVAFSMGCLCSICKARRSHMLFFKFPLSILCFCLSVRSIDCVMLPKGFFETLDFLFIKHMELSATWSHVGSTSINTAATQHLLNVSLWFQLERGQWATMKRTLGISAAYCQHPRTISPRFSRPLRASSVMFISTVRAKKKHSHHAVSQMHCSTTMSLSSRFWRFN